MNKSLITFFVTILIFFILFQNFKLLDFPMFWAIFLSLSLVLSILLLKSKYKELAKGILFASAGVSLVLTILLVLLNSSLI